MQPGAHAGCTLFADARMCCLGLIGASASRGLSLSALPCYHNMTGISGFGSKGSISLEAQVNDFQGKHLCVESLTGPLAHVLEIFVVWICEDVKEIGITTVTTTVFRRATPGSVQ